MEWKVQRNIEWHFFWSYARTYQSASAYHGLITEEGKKFTNIQLLKHFNSFYLSETPGTGLESHSIHLHAVLAKSRIKDTANIIYITMTHLKIWLEWIKSLFNPSPKKKKGMTENSFRS